MVPSRGRRTSGRNTVALLERILQPQIISFPRRPGTLRAAQALRMATQALVGATPRSETTFAASAPASAPRRKSPPPRPQAGPHHLPSGHAPCALARGLHRICELTFPPPFPVQPHHSPRIAWRLGGNPLTNTTINRSLKRKIVPKAGLSHEISLSRTTRTSRTSPSLSGMVS